MGGHGINDSSQTFSGKDEIKEKEKEDVESLVTPSSISIGGRSTRRTNRSTRGGELGSSGSSTTHIEDKGKEKETEVDPALGVSAFISGTGTTRGQRRNNSRRGGGIGGSEE